MESVRINHYMVITDVFGTEIQQLINEINPDELISMHTEHSEMFKE